MGVSFASTFGGQRFLRLQRSADVGADLRVNPTTGASGAEFMHGFAEAPRVIDPAELTEQTASGPVVVLVARMR